jgi:hypothetical protein
VWLTTVFTGNRGRLPTTEMSRRFLAAVLAYSTGSQMGPVMALIGAGLAEGADDPEGAEASWPSPRP